MTFRNFTTSDAEYQLSLRLRDTYLRAPLGLKLNERDTVGEAQQLHFGLFDEQQILASVTFKELSPEQVKLRQMVVDQSQKKSGLGSALIKQAEGEMRKLGYREITLSARATVQAFYEKLGYQKVGDPFTEIGIEHQEMEKFL